MSKHASSDRQSADVDRRRFLHAGGILTAGAVMSAQAKTAEAAASASTRPSPPDAQAYRWPATLELARVRPDVRTGMRNGGWAFDSYPDMPRLRAGVEMEVARIDGPGVITALHSTAHSWPHGDSVKRAEVARGLVLLVYYNGATQPAVQVPLADFFGDGCGGQSQYFSCMYVEKAPESYNAFFPMPFEQSVRVTLRNDTAVDVDNYCFVEFERLPAWDPALGYFHATWRRFCVQATTRAVVPVIELTGPGHLVGRHWSMVTDDPLFHGFTWVMEANNEVRIDGPEPPPPGPYAPNAGPPYDYLGTEDSFGFSWGFRRTHIGLWNGMTLVDIERTPNLLSIYRFRGANVLRFARSLDWRLNWTHEFTRPEHTTFRKRVDDREQAGGAWVDYATTFYWYQQTPGYAHAPLPPLADRAATLLRSSPRIVLK